MKLNKISLYVAGMLSLVGASCTDSYLDKEVDLTLQAEMVFGDYDMTRGFQARLYTYLPDAFAGYGNAQFRLSQDCMTDNAIDFWDVAQYHSVTVDAYDATNHAFGNEYWSHHYEGIRACNQFLLNAKPDVIGNAEKSGDDNKLYDRWMAEARVIRAILHFDLVCWYGDIAIVGDDENDKPMILSPGNFPASRTPAIQVLDWVANEMKEIKDDLPFRYSNEDENWGRVNGAAAYALHARALLYKASPLFNGGGNYWADAAAAAKEFLAKNAKQNRPYTLHSANDVNENYYDIFTSNPVISDEYILSRSVWSTLNLVIHNAPCGFSGSIVPVGYCNPTQNFVDAYETKNGLPIDQDPTYDEQNPYANRDPRLEQTVFYHGMMWGDTDERRAIDVNNDDTRVGLDYRNGNGGTVTGYFCKKYVHNIRFDGKSGNQRVACPIFRYAEVLLNLAEALNEAGQTGEAYAYVNQVRARVGMPGYSGMTQAQLRERIQNERRIELCFEDHRYFDVRRWKLFDEPEHRSVASEANLPRYKQLRTLYGVAIREGSGKTFNYAPSEKYSDFAFNSPKNYFVPVPFDEIQKTGYTQTPGWEL